MFEKLLKIILILVAPFVLFVYLIDSLYGLPTGVVDHVYLLTPLVAVITGARLATTYTLKSAHGKTFLFFTLGLFGWLVGEVVWTFFDIYLGIDPFPSIADVFFILSYPLLFVGLLNEVKLSGLDWFDKKLKPFVLTAIPVLLSVGIVMFYLGAMSEVSPEVSLLENSVALGYGLGDLVLLTFGFLMIRVGFEYKGGRLFNSWLLLSVGLLATLIADYSFVFLAEAYENGVGYVSQVIDLLWQTGYFLYAISLWKMRNDVEEVSSSLTAKKPQK